MIEITEKDRDLIWYLMPGWIKNDDPGLCPTFYGTGSYEGDREVMKRVRDLLGIEEVVGPYFKEYPEGSGRLVSCDFREEV